MAKKFTAERAEFKPSVLMQLAGLSKGMDDLIDLSIGDTVSFDLSMKGAKGIALVVEQEEDIQEIESALYSRGYLIRSRGDIMRLLERFDHIISIISVDLVQFEIENPKIPAELRKEFLKLSELASLAVESTIPGSKAYFTQPEDVAETTERVYFYEKEAVKLSQSIKRTVFHDMVDDLKLSEKFHLRYFALHIEDLAKAAVKVAEQLSVMAIKRAL